MLYRDKGYDYGVEVEVGEIRLWVEYNTRSTDNWEFNGVYVDDDVNNETNLIDVLNDKTMADIEHQVAREVQAVWR